MLSKDAAFVARLQKASQQNEWTLTTLTTATSIVVALNQTTYDGLIWDLTASNLDTTLATIMLIRPTFPHPIIVIATTPSEREQRKLYRAKADAVLERTIAMSVFSALFDQRTWAYQNAPAAVATPAPATPPATTYQLGTITVDPTNYTVMKNGQALNLTKKEFQLLIYLLEHQNQVLSREQLLNGVWGYDLLGTSRIVDMHISHLRDKLEDDPKQPQWLKTVRGFGYRLEN